MYGYPWGIVFFSVGALANSGNDGASSFQGMAPTTSAMSLLQSLDQYDNYYIQYHGCSWSNFIAGEDDGDDQGNQDVDEDGYWYMGAVPSPAANSAFSIYGTNGDSQRPCQKRGFINSFYTSLPTFMDTAGIVDDDEDRSYYCGENGYGLGCTADNRFVYQQYVSSDYYDTYLCDANHVVETTEAMETVNEGLEATGCLAVSQSQLTSLLTYSGACSIADPGCPDPFGRLRQQHTSWQSHQPLSVFRRKHSYASVMTFVSLVGLILTLALLLHEVRVTRRFRRKRQFLKKKRNLWSEKYLDDSIGDDSRVVDQLYDLTNQSVATPVSETLDNTTQASGWLSWFSPGPASLPTVDSGLELGSYESPKTMDSTMETWDSNDEGDSNAPAERSRVSMISPSMIFAARNVSIFDKSHMSDQNVDPATTRSAPPDEATSSGEFPSIQAIPADTLVGNTRTASSNLLNVTPELPADVEDPLTNSRTAADIEPESLSRVQTSSKRLTEHCLENDSCGIGLNSIETPFDADLSPIPVPSVQEPTEVFEVVKDDEIQAKKRGLWRKRNQRAVQVVMPTIPVLPVCGENEEENEDARLCPGKKSLGDESKATSFEKALIAIKQGQSEDQGIEESSIVDSTTGEELEILHIGGENAPKRKSLLWKRKKRLPVCIVPTGALPSPSIQPSASRSEDVSSVRSILNDSAIAVKTDDEMKQAGGGSQNTNANSDARSLSSTASSQDLLRKDEKQSETGSSFSRKSSGASTMTSADAKVECQGLACAEDDFQPNLDTMGSDDCESKLDTNGAGDWPQEPKEAVHWGPDTASDEEDEDGMAGAIRLVSDLCSPTSVELIETMFPKAEASDRKTRRKWSGKLASNTPSRFSSRKQPHYRTSLADPKSATEPRVSRKPVAEPRVSRKPVGVQSFMASSTQQSL